MIDLRITYKYYVLFSEASVQSDSQFELNCIIIKSVSFINIWFKYFKR